MFSPKRFSRVMLPDSTGSVRLLTFLALLLTVVTVACSSEEPSRENEADLDDIAAKVSKLAATGNTLDIKKYVRPDQAELPDDAFVIAMQFVAPGIQTEPSDWAIESNSAGFRVVRLNREPASVMLFSSIDGNWWLDIGPDALSNAFRELDEDRAIQDFNGTVAKQATGNRRLGLSSVQETPVYYGLFNGQFVYASRIILSNGFANSIDTNAFTWTINGAVTPVDVLWSVDVEESAGLYTYPPSDGVFTFMLFGSKSPIQVGEALVLTLGGFSIDENGSETSVTITREFSAEDFRIPSY